MCPPWAADEVRLCRVHGGDDGRARYPYRPGIARRLRGLRGVAVPGNTGAEGSFGTEGSAGLVISRRAVLLGAGAACAQVATTRGQGQKEDNTAGVLTASD